MNADWRSRDNSMLDLTTSGLLEVIFELNKRRHGVNQEVRLRGNLEEEASELIQAICKFRRPERSYDADNNRFLSELGDAIICINAVLLAMPDQDRSTLNAKIHEALIKWTNEEKKLAGKRNE